MSNKALGTILLVGLLPWTTVSLFAQDEAAEKTAEKTAEKVVKKVEEKAEEQAEPQGKECGEKDGGAKPTDTSLPHEEVPAHKEGEVERGYLHYA